MHTMYNKSTKLWGVLTVTIVTCLAIIATCLGIGNWGQRGTYANSDLVNPLEDYVLTGEFTTINGGSYDKDTNPYAISTADDLIRLVYYVNVAKDTSYATASYQLTSHIDLSGYNWQPIGALGYDSESVANIPFSGVFNGNGYSIYGLTIVNTSMESESTVTTAGLFGAVAYASYTSVNYSPVIKLLGLKDVYIESNAYYAGGLAGSVEGDNTSAIVYPTGAIVGDASASAVIQECYSTGYVEGRIYTGGLVGALSDGACIYNSYTAPSANTTAGYDVYSNSTVGGAGGIAGIVVWNSNVGAISKSYSTARAGKVEDNTINIGGIIGDVASTSVARYRSNFYLSTNYTSDIIASTAGASVSATSLKTYSNYYNQDWSVKQVQSGTIERYDRGTVPTHIWKVSDVLNNGFPILTRVSQLASINMSIDVLDAETPADYANVYYSGYTGAAPIVDGTKMYIEQGQSFNINATSLEDEDSPIYTFDDWYSSVVGNRVVESGDSTALNSPGTVGGIYIMPCIATCDMNYTAKFIYAEYSITYNPSDTNLGNVRVKIADDATLGEVDWDSYEFRDGNSVLAKIGTIVYVEATPTAGYEIDSWVVDSQTLRDDGDTANYQARTYEFSVTGACNISVNFIAKTYSITIIAETGQEDVAQLYYSVDGDAPQSTAGTVQYGNIVTLSVDGVDPNYTFANWTVKADGLEEYSLGSASAFTVGDYENYVVIAHFQKNTYSVRIAINNVSVGNVSFVGIEGTGLSRDIAFDQEWTITVTDIPTGYHFVKWDITYNGDQKDESADITNQTLTRSGIQYDMYCVAIVEINTYQVTLNSVDNLQGSLSQGAMTYQFDYGEMFRVLATPAEGYYFNNWTDADGTVLGTNSTLKLIVTDDVTITANFVAINYTVTFFAEVIASDVNPTYSIGNDCFEQTRSAGYTLGDDVSFEAVAPMWFEFDHWEMRTVGITSGVDYTFDNINGTGAINSIHCDIEIIGYFRLQKASVTFQINEASFGDYEFIYNNRTIKYSEITPEDSFVYNIRSVLELKNATPANENYRFSYWTINGVPAGKDNALSVDVTGNIVVGAVFRYTECPVEVLQDTNGGVVTGLNSNYYDYGSVLTLKTTVYPGYKFLGWYLWDRNTGIQQLLSSSTTLVHTITDTQSTTYILAKYAQVGKVDVVLSNNDAGSVTGAGEYEVGTAVTLTAKANDGYQFLYWEVRGEPVGVESTYKVTTTAETQSVNAIFAELQTVTVDVNDSKLGVVEGAGNVGLGSTVTLTATPANNCTFIGWAINDNIVSTDSTYSFVANGDIDVQALFKENFNWAIVIIITGCLLFAILLILAAINYIKVKETEPVNVKYISKTENGDYKVKQKVTKKDLKNAIEPVPVRKIETVAIEPVPVRKINVPPTDYKGNVKTKQKESTSAEIAQAESDTTEKKRSRGRPAGSLNKKGKKSTKRKEPGKRGRPAGSKNKKKKPAK